MNGRSRASREPISPIFSCGLVMVSSEMHSALTSRIYKNGAQQSASEAAFSGDEWSIPRFRAKIPHFTSKIVEHSRHLLGGAHAIRASPTSPTVWCDVPQLSKAPR